MADSIDETLDRQLTTVTLLRAYEQLADMFSRFRIPVTFAFVMAFALSAEEAGEFDNILAPRAGGDDDWLRNYWKARSSGSLEGWHLPEALAVAQRSGFHEIACHGFCHRPLGSSAVSTEAARAELLAARRAAEMKGVELKTLVFPRNQVAHLDVVRSCGLIGYRERLQRPGGSAGRLLRLAEEFYVWPRAHQMRIGHKGMVAIPAGYFFNWRYGLRGKIPVGVTRLRWGNLLRAAAREGNVAHLWLHPHNLVTGPRTAASLEGVLADVARMRDDGAIRVLTQEQYASELLNVDSVAATPQAKRAGVSLAAS